MNSAEPYLGKDAIDHRFIRAVMALIDQEIATTQGEIAQSLGVKTAKFSEIMNGRMHVGVDMLSEISEQYLISPEWLLTGRGDSIFRKSSILPPLRYSEDVMGEHPYLFEDEDEIMKQRIENVEKEEKEEMERNAAPALMILINEKDKLLLSQAEEIGRLKAELAEVKRHTERNAQNVDIDSTANVG